MWCPICFINTMSCLDPITSYNPSFLLGRRRRKEVSLNFLPLLSSTPSSCHIPFLFTSMTPVTLCFSFCNLLSLPFCYFLSISLNSFNNSSIFPYFLYLWSPTIINLFSPGSCLSVLKLPPKLIVIYHSPSLS